MIPEHDPDEPVGYDEDDEPVYAIKPEERSTAALMPEQQGSTIPLGWKPTYEKPIPVVQCTKIKKDDKRCGRWSVRGLDRCIKHAGWNLPVVKQKAQANVESARLKLVAAVPEAADWLIDLAEGASSEAVRLKAIESVMDRSGLRAGTDVNVNVTDGRVNPADILADRLEQLRKRNLEAAEAEKRIVEGVIVEAPVQEDTDDPSESSNSDASEE